MALGRISHLSRFPSPACRGLSQASVATFAAGCCVGDWQHEARIFPGLVVCRQNAVQIVAGGLDLLCCK